MDDVKDNTVYDNPRQPSLLSWLWPVPAGLALGITTLAPFVRGPGDPSGHVIGAGLGGVVGLIVALVVRRHQVK